uniref:Uncharacterized protein n=1 Tax=Tetradesmus obliquus TaxID=3088 RepID=A0A383VKK3_TETOB|eukprot:jgi/Sobl393_1/11263/SZX66065.1
MLVPPQVDWMAWAGRLNQASLLPFLAFLWTLRRIPDAPRRTVLGWHLYLLFVAAAIPAGIYCKTQLGTSMANVDWIHAPCEALLCTANLFIVLGLRDAMAAAKATTAADADATQAQQPAEDTGADAGAEAGSGRGSGSSSSSSSSSSSGSGSGSKAVRALPAGVGRISSSGSLRGSSSGCSYSSISYAATTPGMQLAAGIHRRRFVPAARMRVPMHLQAQSSGTRRSTLAAVRSSGAVLLV